MIPKRYVSKGRASFHHRSPYMGNLDVKLFGDSRNAPSSWAALELRADSQLEAKEGLEIRSPGV